MTPELAQLVTDLIPQAKAIAYRRYSKAPHALERAELEGIALEGLVDAANKWPAYCARRGFSETAYEYFGAYAGRRMNGAILDWMRKLDWLTRAERQRARKIADAGSGLGRTAAELADACGLTVAEVHTTTAALARRPVSLDDSDADAPGGEQAASSSVAVAQILDAVYLAGLALTPLERTVLALRYYEELTLAEIAAALGRDRAVIMRAHDTGARQVHQAMAAAAA